MYIYFFSIRSVNQDMFDFLRILGVQQIYQIAAVINDDRAFVAHPVNPEFHNVGVFAGVMEYRCKVPFNLRFEVHYRTFATYQLLTSWGTVSGLLLTCRKRRSGRRSTHVCGTRSPSTVTNVLPSSGIMVIAP